MPNVKLILRIWLNVATIALLLLCVAAAGLWIRGYQVRDSILFGFFNLHPHPYAQNVTAGRGFLISHESGQSAIEVTKHSCVTGRSRRMFDRYWHHTDDISGSKPIHARSTLGFGFHDGESSTRWVVPDYALLCATAFLPLVRLWRRSRRQMTHREGLCPICGYDVRATPTQCPECGTRFKSPPAAATVQSDSPPDR
jgi:hypothetical protein